MGLDPRVLGAFAKTHLEVIDGWPDGLGSRVRAATDPAALAAIEKASRISWMPLAPHRALTEALFAEPADLAREICRRTTLASFQQPFLHPIFRGAVTIMGSSLARFASWTPAAWSALFRDVGSLSWKVDGEGSGRLILDDPAAAIVESPAYVEGLAGAFSSFFEVTDTTGEVRVSASPRRLEFLFVWSADASSTGS